MPSPTRLLRRPVILAVVLAGLAAAIEPAPAQEPATASSTGETAEATSGPAEPPAAVVLNHRRIVEFRSRLLGDTPAERAEMATGRLQEAVEGSGPGRVSRTSTGESVRFELDGATLFFLMPEDLDGPRTSARLDIAAQKVATRLELAVREARERTDLHALAWGAARAAIATAVLLVLLRLLSWARRRLGTLAVRQLEKLQDHAAARHVVATYAGHARTLVGTLGAIVSWAVGLLLVGAWATYALHQFAYTRPWSERTIVWLVDTLQRFALAAAGAVPGLLTALLIFLFARLLAGASGLFLQKIERGEVQVGWLDLDTARPTRRLATVVIWLFALAMAYPYLPGAGTEAFKGLTVLAGLMLSLGASGVVGQAMAGLSLMYSRSIRVGEYVKIGETEGTVTSMGVFATKIHTGMGEEVSLPNAVAFAQPIRNFSRLVSSGRFILATQVTIGYATPWRQVRALLLEAARRTPGVAQEPAPFVVQTALSDFYVEYRLAAQADSSAPTRRALALDQLHANIQDVFNEAGVQIMSPHYMADPPEPQVAKPGEWVPARRAG